MVQDAAHEAGQRQDKGQSAAHSAGSFRLLGNAKERADPEELAQHYIIREDRRNDQHQHCGK